MRLLLALGVLLPVLAGAQSPDPAQAVEEPSVLPAGPGQEETFYACTACQHRMEVRQSFSDDALTTCPECGGRLRKRFDNVGIVFKGSGFYRTDSRGSGGGDTSGPAKADAAASGDGAKAGSGDGAKAGSGSGAGGSGSTGSGSTGSGTSSTPAPAKTAPASS